MKDTISYYTDVKEICDRLAFPADAKEEFLNIEKRLAETPQFFSELAEQVDRLCKERVSIHNILPEIKGIAEKYGIHFFTLNFIFVMHCSVYTREKYAEEGLPDSLFWDGLADLKYKLSECRNVKGINGTFTEGWYEGFLRLGRFTLGRFQFEPFGLYEGEDKKLECGYVLKKGTRFVIIHIPGSGVPLTDEVRSCSYKMAYDYFKEWVGNETVLLNTYSWLLYPRAAEFLPESSNIVKFMKDFDIYEWSESEQFFDAWRVFGKTAELPPAQWAEDTSLQRAYKKWILNGNKAGAGKGFIVMHNGENVTHIKDYFG